MDHMSQFSFDKQMISVQVQVARISMFNINIFSISTYFRVFKFLYTCIWSHNPLFFRILSLPLSFSLSPSPPPISLSREWGVCLSTTLPPRPFVSILYSPAILQYQLNWRSILISSVAAKPMMNTAPSPLQMTVCESSQPMHLFRMHSNRYLEIQQYPCTRVLLRIVWYTFGYMCVHWRLRRFRPKHVGLLVFEVYRGCKIQEDIGWFGMFCFGCAFSKISYNITYSIVYIIIW